MSAPSSLGFDEDGPMDVDLLGGKAASLHRLTRGGAPVPEGFTLTTRAFERWVEDAGAVRALEEVREALCRGDPRAGRRAAALAEYLEGAPLGGALREELTRRLARLPGDGPVAVRSSGVLEDSEEHSFAGLYETALDVPRDRVAEEVVRCFGSLLGARAVGYLGARRVAPARLAMAVAVQRMARADHSGVAFSLDPLGGRETDARVELVPGTGEALVAGRVDPSRLVLREDRTAGTFAPVEEEWRGAVPEGERAGLRRALAEDLLPEVRRLTADEGRPLDVEFAFEGGRVRILQARPITAVRFAPELGEWTNADFNEGGVSTGVCSPFMWSLYDTIWERHLPGYLREIGLELPVSPAGGWGRTFFGVPYWNVGAVKASLAAVPGYDEGNFDEDLGIEKDYGAEGPARTPVTPWSLLAGLRVLVRMYREFGRQAARTAALLDGFDARERRWLGVDLEAAEDGLLFDLFAELIERDYLEVEGTYFRTIFNSSNAKLEFKSSLDAWNRGNPEPLSYLDLMSGMRGLRTLESAHDLGRLCAELRELPGVTRLFETLPLEDLAARFERERGLGGGFGLVDAYLRKHAHHSRRELDPRVPRWGEDVPFVLERVRQGLRELDPARRPEEVEEAQHRRYLAERARARAQLAWRPLRRWWLLRALDRTRRYCWLREETRDRSTRAYRAIRLYTLEVARRLRDRGVLAEVDDVFLLSWQDVVAATRGELATSEVRARVERAREWSRRWRNFSPPRELGAGLRAATAADGDPGDGALRGVGGAPGVARGPARVLRSLEEADKLRRGDVLVAEFTDPGWTPLLGMVAAVVTEVGGVLSHAAVISREYGVPAVLSVRGATRTLRDGQVVEVDGDRGRVRVVDP